MEERRGKRRKYLIVDVFDSNFKKEKVEGIKIPYISLLASPF